MQSAGAIASQMGAGVYATPLALACVEFEIDNDRELAHFLAQLHHESAGFKRVSESLNYSVDGLLKTFGRNRISAEDCARYGRTKGRAANQVMIATKVYGGEWGRAKLGNIFQGDGYKFRGRGLIQTTGRSNYAATSHGLFGNESLVDDPTPLETNPTLIARAAAWFWKSRNCDKAAARDDIVGVTRAINGGLNGIDDRQYQLARAKKLLGIP
jgi:putative chitinase